MRSRGAFDRGSAVSAKPNATDVRRLTLDIAKGGDASVSTIEPTNNLRHRKAPVCLVAWGAKTAVLRRSNF